MKRCSKCHFTFDDYVEFCDFDSTELAPCPVSVPLLDGSFFIRVVTSRVFLGFLAMAGVMSSALLIGYFDAVSQSKIETVENSERREAAVSQAPPVDASKKSPAQTRVLPPTRPRIRFRTKPRVQPSTQSSVQYPTQSRGQLRAQSRIGLPTRSRTQLAAQSPVQPRIQIVSDNLARKGAIPAAKNSSSLSRPPATTFLPRADASSSAPIKSPTLDSAPIEKESKATAILKKAGKVLKKTASFLKKPF